MGGKNIPIFGEREHGGGGERRQMHIRQGRKMSIVSQKRREKYVPIKIELETPKLSREVS